MGLREEIMHEPVSALSIRQKMTVRPGTSVREVGRMMKQAQLGCVFVVDEEGRPIGKFREGLLVGILAKHPEKLDEPVENYMVEVGGCVKASDPIVRVMEHMLHTEVRFVCVVDEEGRVAGLTGQKGLMEYVAEHFPRQVQAQPMQTKLHMDEREGA
jgi:CBS domain-containing protein